MRGVVVYLGEERRAINTCVERNGGGGGYGGGRVGVGRVRVRVGAIRPPRSTDVTVNSVSVF